MTQEVDYYLTEIPKLLDANKGNEALQLSLEAYSNHSNDLRIVLGLAKSYMAAERFAASLFHLHRLEANEPSNFHVLKLLGEANNRLDNWYEAERYYKKALEVKPDVVVMTILEQILREQARYDEVREILAEILKRLPTIKDSVACSIGMLDIMDGKLLEGFQGYEKRFDGFKHLKDAYGKEYFPRWDGRKKLTGKHVLIRFEQGLGDTIQFVRYAKQLKELGATRIGVLCKPTLFRLVMSIPEVDEVFEKLGSTDRYDYEVMIMSLPALLRTKSFADIPNQPYMSVKAEDVAKWAELMPSTGRKKIGIVWGGELKKGRWDTERMNIRRSIPLEKLRPLFDADHDFYSLQKGENEKDLINYMPRRQIINLMDKVTDFYDTACIIENLDLVIAVDTSTAHVAGAIGKEVWMLSRIDGDWRWFRNRIDSPWYASMRVYWQEQFFDWRSIIKKVAKDLKDY